jgi:hypothetical protein
MNLTLPSSGPAYGRPLKSNVERQQSGNLAVGFSLLETASNDHQQLGLECPATYSMKYGGVRHSLQAADCPRQT